MGFTFASIGANARESAAAKAVLGTGRVPLTHAEAAKQLGIKRAALTMRLAGFRSHLTPDQRQRFDAALSRSKRRVRAGSYNESAAA